jgi:diacylglycerol kinase family enzyme
MRASDIDLSVIHQGTGGDFALSLGIPKTEDEAIAVALGDQRRRIDASVAFYHVDSQITALADIDDANPHLRIRGFASCANVGMSSDVVRMVRGRLKRVGNSGAFAVATVRCITRNRERIMSVHAGGSEVQRGNFVDIAVCTSKYMGGGMFVAPDARPDDGMFDVVMIGGASRFKLLRTFPKIYRGTHVHDPLVSIATCGEVTIDPHGGRADGVVLDGELVGVTPARFSVIPAALDVRVAATPTPTS